MNRRTTIVLLLLAVLLAGFLVLTRSETLTLFGEEEEEEDTGLDLETMFEEAETDEVVAFSIVDNQTGDRFAAELEEEGWRVTESAVEAEEGQVVDAVRLDIAANSIGTMVSTRELSEFESLTQYGLETAQYTLTFRTRGGGEFSLDIGNKTPQEGHYYTQRRGSQAVNLVSAAVLDSFVGFLSEPPYAEPTPTPTPTS